MLQLGVAKVLGTAKGPSGLGKHLKAFAVEMRFRHEIMCRTPQHDFFYPDRLFAQVDFFRFDEISVPGARELDPAVSAFPGVHGYDSSMSLTKSFKERVLPAAAKREQPGRGHSPG